MKRLHELEKKLAVSGVGTLMSAFMVSYVNCHDVSQIDKLFFDFLVIMFMTVYLTTFYKYDKHLAFLSKQKNARNRYPRYFETDLNKKAS